MSPQSANTGWRFPVEVAMDISTVKKILASIRDKFVRIRTITGSLQDDFSGDRLGRVIAERGALIDQIAAERGMLAATDTDWQREARRNRILADLLQDIEQTVFSIKSVDETVRGLVSRQLAVIRTDLDRLYHHSRAACAYAAHASRVP